MHILCKVCDARDDAMKKIAGIKKSISNLPGTSHDN